MSELFIELFSEEIPARMQARAAEDLARLLGEALASLGPSGIRVFSGPRRIAFAAAVAGAVPASRSSERGPRRSAPEQALAGFLRKHAATRDDLREEGDFWVLDKIVPGIDAAIDADVLPVDTHATRFIPSLRACAVPATIPLSLNEPDGLSPSYWRWSRPALTPTKAPTPSETGHIVCPSPIVTTDSRGAYGSSSWNRQTPL